jgi:polyisoprenoid-binding protein YceI
MSIESTATRPAIAAGRYTIDPTRTIVRFAVKELWGLVTVRGTLGVTGGAIVVADDPSASSALVTLDPATFASGSKRRDKDVTSRNFLDVAAYPEMAFTSTRVASGPDGWTMTGMLTAHGVTVPVTLRLLEGRATPSGCAFTATAVVDRTAHGVSKAAGFIARKVDVTIEVTAQAG